jgi:hypothetical protein
MQSERELHFSEIDKQQLIQLLEELLLRHPVLREEMISILAQLGEADREAREAENIDDEVTEDWDFSGDEAEPDKLPIYAQPVLHAKERQAPHLRLEEFTTRLRREQTSKSLLALLSDVIDETITCSAQGNTADALDLYALMFNERFQEHPPEITTLYDDMIDAAMPTLEGLLDAASSNAHFDKERASLSPVLKPEIRRKWLERLFVLWIKRLSAHRIEEDLPDMMLDVSWNEDVPFLRRLVQEAIQREQRPSSSNIVDFTSQYRTKALEKFLRALPLPHKQ